MYYLLDVISSYTSGEFWSLQETQGSSSELLNVVFRQHISCRGCGRMSSRWGKVSAVGARSSVKCHMVPLCATLDYRLSVPGFFFESCRWYNYSCTDYVSQLFLRFSVNYFQYFLISLPSCPGFQRERGLVMSWSCTKSHRQKEDEGSLT